jgi:hypothetical protein
MSVMWNWEKYAKTILSSEVDPDITPGVDEDNDEDSPALKKTKPRSAYPITFGPDKLPIFPISDKDIDLSLKERKDIIRNFLKAHYR